MLAALNPIRQPSEPFSLGPEAMALFLLFYLMAPPLPSPPPLSLSLFLMVPSPGNLKPAYVSSSQLLATGVFIYQSELTGGKFPEAT